MSSKTLFMRMAEDYASQGQAGWARYFTRWAERCVELPATTPLPTRETLAQLKADHDLMANKLLINESTLLPNTKTEFLALAGTLPPDLLQDVAHDREHLEATSQLRLELQEALNLSSEEADDLSLPVLVRQYRNQVMVERQIGIQGAP